MAKDINYYNNTTHSRLFMFGKNSSRNTGAGNLYGYKDHTDYVERIKIQLEQIIRQLNHISTLGKDNPQDSFNSSNLQQIRQKNCQAALAEINKVHEVIKSISSSNSENIYSADDRTTSPSPPPTFGAR